MKNFIKFLERNEGLVLLLLLAAVLRIPSLYEPYWYGDEGIYLVLGQALRKGLVWYRDIHDNKPPMLYLLAAVSGSVFYFRLLLLVWFEATIVVFFKLMQKLLPKHNRAWYLATLTMIGLTTAAEGNIANAEIFMVLPTVAAIYLVLLSKKQVLTRWLGAGLLFSLAFLLKVPAGFDWAAAILWLVFFQPKKIKETLALITSKKLWGLILGFGLPIGVSIAYYNAVGGLQPYLGSALLQNVGYLSSWSTGTHTAGPASQDGMITRGIILAITLLGLFLAGKKLKLSDGFKLVSVWFLMALFGALLSERPYPHYLIQPIIPASIMVGYFIYDRSRQVKLLVTGLVVLAVLAYFQVGFWHYPVISYYQNFIDYATGNKSEKDYRLYFDSRVEQTYHLADYLKQTTFPDSSIFIWGDEPYIYALADRLPIGRYAVAYHVVDFNGFEETIEAWDQNPPEVVLVMDYEQRSFPEMFTRLATDYVLVDSIDQATIYRKVNGPAN